MKKVLSVLLLMVAAMGMPAVYGQNPADEGWQSTDQLLLRLDFPQAMRSAERAYDRAKRSHDSYQLLTALIYRTEIGGLFREDWQDSSLLLLKQTMPLLDDDHQGICHLLYADFYCQIRKKYQWRMRRNQETGEADLPLHLWPLQRLDDSIFFHVDKVLAHKEFLQRARVEDYGRLLTEGMGGATENLLDVAVFWLGSKTSLDNLADASPSHAAERLYAPMDVFAREEFPEIAAEGFDQRMAVRYLYLLQAQARANLGASAERRLWIDLKRVHRCYQIELLKRLYAYHAGLDSTGTPLPDAAPSPEVSQLCDHISEKYYNMEDYVSAMEWAERGIDMARRYCTDSVENCEGYADCVNDKKMIEEPSVFFADEYLPMVSPLPGRYAATGVNYRNMDTLYYRVVGKPDRRLNYDTELDELRQLPVVKEWSQPCLNRHDYKRVEAVAYVPPLPKGEYVLIVGADWNLEHTPCAAKELIVSDLDIVGIDAIEDHGLIVMRTDGSPVAGRQVVRQRFIQDSLAGSDTTYTDKAGHYHFEHWESDDWRSKSDLYADSLLMVNDSRSYNYGGGKWIVDANIFFSKPVYRMGEEVEYMISLTSPNRGGADGCVYPEEQIEVRIKDPNGRELACDTLLTDAFGRCSGRLRVPTDGLDGQYHLWSTPTDNLSTSIETFFRVEAYKQPKFMVTLTPDSGTRQFGKELKVAGMAASYSGAPLDGAKVKYSVVCRKMEPWWRYGVSQDWSPFNKTVAHGETMTREDGSFEIAFMPMPDPEERHNEECYYRYEVKADVTDLNGESNSTTRNILISRENGVAVFARMGGRKFDEVLFRYLDVEGRTAKGSLKVKVECLREPDVPLLTTADAYQSMDSATFRELFPSYAYDAHYNDMDRWGVAKTVYDADYQVAEDGLCRVAIGDMKSGIYRVTLNDGRKDWKTYVSVTTPKEKRCRYPYPLWMDAPDTAKVGETAVIRMGSPFKGICVHYRVTIGNVAYKQGMLKMDGRIKTIKVPVTKSMRGGFSVDMFTIKDGSQSNWMKNVAVPYDKGLTVELESFRDKIEPGSQEQWTLKVTSHGEPVESAVLATLYDESLSQFGELAWGIIHTRNNFLINGFTFDHRWLRKEEFESGLDFMESRPWGMKPYKLKGIGSTDLIETMFTIEAERDKVIELGVPESGMRLRADDIARMPGTSIESIVGAIAGGSQDMTETIRNELTVEQEEQAAATPEIRLRSDLRSSAFFMPQLKSDPKTGRIELSFTMPELLTQWHLHTLAWTKDMAVGRMEHMVVTQKRLMVTPNLPRFLRHGDKVVLQAKVDNLDDKDQQAKVALELTNAQDGSRFFADSRQVSVAAGRSSMAEFEFEVPDNVYVARYRITATGQGCSDGEQAELPVLANRQIVTESMAMYINGRGEKQYTFESLKNHSSATAENYGLQLEWTSNPVWYALQSIPYMKELESPSHSYLANQIYVNHIGLSLLEKNPEIETTLRRWSQEDTGASLSPLEKNESLKQTLLQESPWMQQAKTESEQHRRLADYYESEKIQKLLRDTEHKLIEGQMGNGAWSWMPKGSTASLYTTETILRQMGELKRMGAALSEELQQALTKALVYAELEEQHRYEKYVKDKSDCEAIDIYYLYMRSFWNDILGTRSSEAFDHYYRNALKGRNRYTDLHTRAQLALIFYRNGNKAEAREMAKAIKGIALKSDEMGMYWRDNQGGCYWYQRPIETQSLLIEMMDEVLQDKESVALMQQWLLKQKQTTHWNSDAATAHAVAALMKGGQALMSNESTTVRIGSQTVESDDQTGLGTISKSWQPEEIDESMAAVSISKATDGIAWGAMYWQYFENLDKIPYSEMGIRMEKRLYRIEADGSLAPMTEARVGDKIRVRILIDCDRNLEYLELKDQRAGGLEPVSTRSGWCWNDGLSYYADIRDASGSFFIDRMEKGRYVLEYDLWANNAGDFSTGVATMQCMYAPEFRCTTAGSRIRIK